MCSSCAKALASSAVLERLQLLEENPEGNRDPPAAVAAVLRHGSCSTAKRQRRQRRCRAVALIVQSSRAPSAAQLQLCRGRVSSMVVVSAAVSS